MNAVSRRREPLSCDQKKGDGHGSMENMFQKVYAIVRMIPEGRVTTYGEIASMLGNPRLSRAVGYALHGSPDDPGLPCHRVVNRFGGLSRAFEQGGVNEQRQLLEEEGVPFTKEGNVDLQQVMWTGSGPKGEVESE